MPFRYNRGIRIAVNLGLSVVFLLAITEIMLWLVSLLGADPAFPERDPTRSYVLAVGDSFTRTAGLQEEENYPAHLQKFLDEKEPETFHSVNLGVVGVSTSYLKDQLNDHITRYRPEFVIVWAGNNIRPDMLEEDGTTTTSAIPQFVQHSEILRFIQVWFQDREAEAAAKELEAQAAEGPGAKFIRAKKKQEEEDPNYFKTLEEKQMRAMLKRDYRQMIEISRASGAEVILLTYPSDLAGHFLRANAVMREIAEEMDVPIVSSYDASARVPEGPGKWLWALHPSNAIHREIARDLAEIILADRTAEHPTYIETSGP